MTGTKKHSRVKPKLIYRVLRSKNNKSGFILPIVVTVVVILCASGIGLLRLGSNARMRTALTISEIRARAAADAGLTEALYKMNKGLYKSFYTSSYEGSYEGSRESSYNDLSHDMYITSSRSLPNTNADYTYKIGQDSGGSYKIISTGRSGRMEKTVSATLKREGFWEHALFAQGYAHPEYSGNTHWLNPPRKGGKIIIEGYNVDGYNSNPAAEYSGALEIRTNSKHTAIKIKDDIYINGDIVLGPGADPERDIKIFNNAEVTGQMYAAADNYALPPVKVPEAVASQPAVDYTYNEGQPLTGNITFKKFDIPAAAKQEIVGDCTIYVTDIMQFQGDGELIITEGSSLTLYLDKKLEIKNEQGGIDNQTLKPTNLRIFGTPTCNSITLENMDTFYGAVYAPLAKIEVKNSGEIRGALVGWDVELSNKNGSTENTFYYDEALKDSGTVRFVRSSWSEE